MHLGVALILLIGHVVVAFYVHMPAQFNLTVNPMKIMRVIRRIQAGQATPIARILLRSHDERTARTRFKSNLKKANKKTHYKT